MAQPVPSNDSLRQFRREDLPDISDSTEDEVSADIFERARSSSWRGRGDIWANPSRNTQQILNYIKPVPSGYFGLDRHGFPLYVELYFYQDKNKTAIESAVAMFRALDIYDSVMEKLTDHLGTQRTINQVWIPADLSHPHGWFFRQLGDATHPHRLKGLLINLMGSQNAIMCKPCIRSYTTSKTWNNEHFMYPFHACKSLPGLTDGQCGCCVWRGDGKCEWADLPGYIPIHPQEGTLGYSLQGKKTAGRLDPKGWSVDQMNVESAPPLTFDWPVLHQDGESAKEFNARVKEAEDRINQSLQDLDAE
jgi:hypothetical protein